jgi:hypothetical protein
MLAYLTGRLAFEAFRRESVAHLEAIADEALLSARAWSEAHSAEIGESPLELPLDSPPVGGAGVRARPSIGLLPPGIEGTLTLKLIVVDGEDAAIECRVSLARGPKRLERLARWAAMMRSGDVNAESPASP